MNIEFPFSTQSLYGTGPASMQKAYESDRNSAYLTWAVILCRLEFTFGCSFTFVLSSKILSHAMFVNPCSHSTEQIFFTEQNILSGEAIKCWGMYGSYSRYQKYTKKPVFTEYSKH